MGRRMKPGLITEKAAIEADFEQSATALAFPPSAVIGSCAGRSVFNPWQIEHGFPRLLLQHREEAMQLLVDLGLVDHRAHDFLAHQLLVTLPPAMDRYGHG